MYSLVMGIAVIVAAPAPKEAKKPPVTLIGEWSIESNTVFGMLQQPEETHKTVRFSSDGTSSTLGGTVTNPEVFKFTHDAKASPATIDFEKDGVKFPGIYKIEGDVLTLCYTIRGGRPDTFTASDQTILSTLTRVKKD